MPDIDYSADIKITVAQGIVTAEIPLAGHASEHWMERFRTLASESRQELPAEVEAADREDRTWVIVRLPATSTDPHTGSTMNAVKALISQANRMEPNRGGPSAITRVVGAQTAFVIRGWWEGQKQEQPGHR
jgi:hypothetical protein